MGSRGYKARGARFAGRARRLFATWRAERGRGIGRFAARVCVSLVPVLVLAFALPGCGGSAAKDYTTQVSQVIFAINNAEGEIKKYWELPMAQQAGVKTTVDAFRKSLASTQEKLDATDPPEECRKLDDTLRDIVGQGRVMADIVTGYSDYLDDMAPISKEIDGLVSNLDQLAEADSIPGGLNELTALAEKAAGEARAVVPPSVFNGLHQEYLEYVSGLVAKLQKAEATIGLDRQTPGGDRDRDAPDDEEDSEDRDNDEMRSENRTVEPMLEDIPDQWAAFNNRLDSMLATVREVIGMNAKVAELEGLIGVAVGEIGTLEKRYK